MLFVGTLVAPRERRNATSGVSPRLSAQLKAVLRDRGSYQIDPAGSWLLAAAEKNLPIFVPGWEDSTLGNVFAAWCINGKVAKPTTVRGGLEYMIELTAWYRKVSAAQSIGYQ